MLNYFEDFFFITTTKRAPAMRIRLPPMIVNIIVPSPPVWGSLEIVLVIAGVLTLTPSPLVVSFTVTS